MTWSAVLNLAERWHNSTSKRTKGRWSTPWERKRRKAALLRTPSAMACFGVVGFDGSVRRAGDGTDYRPHPSGVYGMDARHLIPTPLFRA